MHDWLENSLHSLYQSFEREVPKYACCKALWERSFSLPSSYCEIQSFSDSRSSCVYEQLEIYPSCYRDEISATLGNSNLSRVVNFSSFLLENSIEIIDLKIFRSTLSLFSCNAAALGQFFLSNIPLFSKVFPNMGSKTTL